MGRPLVHRPNEHRTNDEVVEELCLHIQGLTPSVYSASVTRVKGADLGLRCLSIFQSRSRKC